MMEPGDRIGLSSQSIISIGATRSVIDIGPHGPRRQRDAESGAKDAPLNPSR